MDAYFKMIAFHIKYETSASHTG